MICVQLQIIDISWYPLVFVFDYMKDTCGETVYIYMVDIK